MGQNNGGMSADPEMIAYVGQQFKPIARYLYEIGQGGSERLELLLAACGDDAMGKQIEGQLRPTMKIIEDAVGSVGAAVENTSHVMAALAVKLHTMEHNNVANVQHGFKR
ncbi:hypothetical protein [Amycolatopsis samaneae]|uniref:Uncharacterized protein n=1 Tax=Amycolatopsis samaneae TaxID=664691 RepID=A0ABW5GGR5_9PSEU